METQQIKSHQILNHCNLCNRYHINKNCSCKSQKKYRQTHCIEKNEINNNYYSRNKIKICARRRIYWKLNNEKMNAKQRAYRDKNKDKINKRKREKYHADIEKSRKQVRNRARKQRENDTTKNSRI